MFEIIKKVEEQKEKMFRKWDLWTLWDRFIDEFDWYSKWTSLANLISHLLAILMSSDFQIKIEIPEIEIEIPPPEHPEFNLGGYQKAVYGKSPYDRSYYDPPQLVEALKKLFMYIITQGFKYTKSHVDYRSIAQSLGISEDLVRDYMMRVDFLMRVFTEQIICGFWICGMSKLSKTERVWLWSGDADVLKYTAVTPDFEYLDPDSANSFEPAFAPICGFWICGFGRSVPRGRIIYRPVLPKEFTEWVDSNVLSQLDRFVFNLTGFKLWEPVKYYESRKVIRYGEKMTLMYMIEEIVKNMLTTVNVDPIKIQSYVNAIWEFIFGKVKKHRPCKQGFKYVTDEEWKRYIVEKWRKAGLDVNVLNQLIERFKGIAEIVWERLEKGIY